MSPADIRRTEHQLRRLYAIATPDERTTGRNWYPSVRRLLAAWGKEYHQDVRTIAALTAMISPQCNWTTNLDIAHTILAGKRGRATHGAIRRNVRIARRILKDRARSIAHYCQGPKVRAFAENLAGSRIHVTIDIHAAQAALNAPTRSVRVDKTMYRTLADIYTTTAYQLGEQPAAFQAIVWIVWKRIYSPERKRAMQRRERR